MVIPERPRRRLVSSLVLPGPNIAQEARSVAGAPALQAENRGHVPHYYYRAFHARFGKSAAFDGDHEVGRAHSVGVMSATTAHRASMAPAVAVPYPVARLNAKPQKSNALRAWLWDERTSTKHGNATGLSEDAQLPLTDAPALWGVLVNGSGELAAGNAESPKIDDLGSVVARW